MRSVPREANSNSGRYRDRLSLAIKALHSLAGSSNEGTWPSLLQVGFIIELLPNTPSGSESRPFCGPFSLWSIPSEYGSLSAAIACNTSKRRTLRLGQIRSSVENDAELW
jgi:hypothetical protein